MASPALNCANLAAFSSVFSQALEYFAGSESRFMVLRTVGQGSGRPSMLYVLDSSFNPPTRAHLQMAISALKSRPGPKRLLLLLATQNADKTPKPASIEQRLVMMTLFGEAVREEVKEEALGVDVGITKMPYFHDKAETIDQDARYAARTEEGKMIATEQVYLVGYDSLVRIFDRKYYPKEEGFRVLEPFLSKHRLRVTMRPDDQWGYVKAQQAYVDDIRTGKRGEEGLKTNWADRIELAEGKEDGEAVSSTEARKAAKGKDKDCLIRMLPEKIVEYIQAEELYRQDQ